MTADATMTAVLAVLNAALSPRKAYDLDKVPQTRPPQSVEVTLTRIYGGSRRTSSGIATTGYRLRVIAVSNTTVSSIRGDLEKCRAVLERKRVTVGSGKTTPFLFETEDDADYGTGWFAQYAAYTFAVKSA